MNSIAIIGAGLAGLGAGQELQRRGLLIKIYEKSRGASGRLSTRREDWAHFDHGAQYFTARDPRFLSQIERWQKAGIVAPWLFEPMTWRRGELRSSPDRENRWVGVPGMSSLGRHMAKELPIKCETHIEEIQRRPDGWWLTDHHGVRHGPHAGLIISAPGQQTAELLPTASPLRASVARIKMQPCWAVTLAFKQKITKPWVQGIFCDHPQVRWVACNSKKPGRHGVPETWIMHMQPQWSAAHLHVTQPQLLAVAKQSLGEILQHSLPAPEHTHVHRWLYAQPADEDGMDSIHDAHRHLAVCGDWTLGGRVEGAYISGLRAAGAVAGEWLGA